jgi:imidazolonepropionase
MWDILLLDCHAATMVDHADEPYGAIRDAALGIQGGRLSFVGTRESLPAPPEDCARRLRRLNGAWITPGLVDCHTHLVFGGDRAHEWELRAKGASYEEIARGGGGILATVRATREESLDSLAASAARRMRTMAGQGATTVEVKSGYGLDLETETKMLRAAALAGDLADMRVSRTFLGAHALPHEFASNRNAYLDRVCDEMIPAIAREKLADAVDVFCETIAFTRQETERIFLSAKAFGLPLKVHAEQLSDSGGAALAAKHGALSADHLEYLSERGIAAMKESGTVAVLLPAAFYFLREQRVPPIEGLRRAGVPIAIATDCNPGTAPVTAPLMALNMGCTLFGLSPEEALAGMTRNAARALNLEKEVGTLETGKRADLAIWNIGEPAELAYWIDADLLADRYYHGRSDHERRP